MPPSLFRNKKGQTFDLLGGFQRAIDWLLTSAPKPLLYLLFLLFIIGFSAIFSVLLNTTGHFCDTAGNEYKTGTLELVTNIRLLTSMPDNEELQSETLDADKFTKGTVQECSGLYSSTDWEYVEKGGDKERKELTTGYYFNDDGCIECTTSVYAYPIGFGAGLGKINICLDEQVYPKPREDRGFLSKMFCGQTLGRCEVPEGYYYDSNTDRFVCDDDLCRQEEGETTTVGELWNLKLLERGAVIQPPSQYGDRDYRNAIRIECDQADLDPKFRFFGINIFDYKLWIFLFILTALIWLLFKLKT